MDIDTSNIASKIKFVNLCCLCDKVSSLQQKNKKEECLRKYVDWFQDFAKKEKISNPTVDDSFYPVFRLLLPALDRDRGPYGIKEFTLAKVYIRVLCLPKEGMDARKLLNYKAPHAAGSQAGDFADVAYWVLKNRCPKGGQMTVEQVNDRLDRVAQKHAENNARGVDEELMIMLRAMSAEEQRWLIRILLKDLKIGMGQNKIFRSFHPDAHELYDVCNSLSKVCLQLKDPAVRLNEIEISMFAPFRAMLSERCDVSKLETILKKGQHLFVETKHDGERFQLHMNNGEFRYFSKNGFEYTKTFGGSVESGLLTPLIVKLFRPNVQSCILDGEMMGWNIKMQYYHTKSDYFDVKSLKPGDKHRPCFCVFDILLLNGKVLSNQPLEERCQVLDTLFKPEKGVIALTKRKSVTKKEEVIEALNYAIDNRLEGIIMKDPTSVYKPNTRKGGWFKIKPEYTDGLTDHVDVIIMGGYHGTRNGLISHFLVAVARPSPEASSSAKPTDFYSMGRVGSGYTVNELAELLLKLQPYWKPVMPGICPPGLHWTKEKPDFWIAPQNSYILEVKATEICYSNQYKTGYTLKFPRVESIKYDKKWFECMTTTEFEELRTAAGGKLYMRHATMTEETPVEAKKRRVVSKPIATLPDQFRAADLSEVNVATEILQGKEFCVLSGWKELTKQEIETMVVQNGGKIVQNMKSTTFCALAGAENNLRVKNAIKFKKYDVVQIDWLMRVLSEKEGCSLPPWKPADLMCPSASTERNLSGKYDEFGDSFYEPATRASLEFSLRKAEGKRKGKYIDQKDMADLDIELFSDTSPYGIFRLCRAYFDKSGDNEDISFEINSLDFAFYGGKICETIDDQTTHVVIQTRAPERLQELNALNHSRATKLFLVNAKWIEDSVRKRKRQHEREERYGFALLPRTEFVDTPMIM